MLQSTYGLCANYYTGVVYSPLNGQCGGGQIQIDPTNETFCIDTYTGRLLYLFGSPCNPPRRAHVLPDDGELLTCVSYYTGVNRAVGSHSQCTPTEAPNTIPAAINLGRPKRLSKKGAGLEPAPFSLHTMGIPE
ncbi:MAG: hypothetical protein R2849_17455 [Thermomicrobiales bacterium]